MPIAESKMAKVRFSLGFVCFSSIFRLPAQGSPVQKGILAHGT
jgi:hypothetical protein